VNTLPISTAPTIIRIMRSIFPVLLLNSEFIEITPRFLSGRAVALYSRDRLQQVLSCGSSQIELTCIKKSETTCTGQPLARISHQLPRISRSRFVFTRDFLTERNTSVYFQGKKILCGNKDQARSWQSGEKCGLGACPTI
jgi:hypothetical protein